MELHQKKSRKMDFASAVGDDGVAEEERGVSSEDKYFSVSETRYASSQFF